jgi:hypothetical protein
MQLMFVNERGMVQSAQNHLFVSYSYHSQYFNSPNLRSNYFEKCAEIILHEIVVRSA